MFYQSNHGQVPDPNPNLLGVKFDDTGVMLTAGTYHFCRYLHRRNRCRERTYWADPQLQPLPALRARTLRNCLRKLTGAQGVCVYVSESEYTGRAPGLPTWSTSARGHSRFRPMSAPLKGEPWILGACARQLLPARNRVAFVPGEQTNGAVLIDSGEVPGTQPTSNIVFDNCDIGNDGRRCHRTKRLSCGYPRQ